MSENGLFRAIATRPLSTDLAQPARVPSPRVHVTLGLRAHAISKVFAVLFVTMIVVPFTAPFKTFEIGRSHTDCSQDGLVKDKGGTDETLACPPSDRAPTPILVFVAAPLDTHLNQIEAPRTSFSILRL